MYPYSSYSYVYNGYVQARTILIVALLVAVILAVVLYFTFLSKKMEGKFTAIKGKKYIFFAIIHIVWYTEIKIKIHSRISVRRYVTFLRKWAKIALYD